MAIENELEETKIKVIKSIIATHAKYGATIEDISNDYLQYIGKPIGMCNEIMEMIQKIPEIFWVESIDGKLKFYSNCERTRHIRQMIIEQKCTKNTNYENKRFNVQQQQFATRTGSSSSVHQQPCFFKDNYFYKLQKRNVYTSMPNLNNKKNIVRGAYFYNYQLLGDDFFLAVAVAELKCKYTEGHQIQQSGFCKSGLTIDGARKLIKKSNFVDDNVIINIGSVDILHGRELIDIQFDFVELISEFEERGINPIITTLAPIANLFHMPSVRQKVNCFNKFLLQNFMFVIDISQCFISAMGGVHFACYQAASRKVSGSSRAHLLWNKVGRERVIKYLKIEIANRLAIPL